MNANCELRKRAEWEVILDYTLYAPPLTLTQIKEDADDIWRDKASAVDKIVLWQHQLDWIVKSAVVRYGPGAAAGDMGAARAIWEIPLEVRE